MMPETDLLDLDTPWSPASARPFRVGDRVRIQINPECRAMFSPFDPIVQKFVGRPVPHPTSENGIAGTVIEIHPEFMRSQRAPGHIFLVDFDCPIREWSVTWFRGLVCFQELELLTPAPEADACPS